MNCVACGKRLTRPYLDCTFRGGPDSRLDGVPFSVHPGCIRLQFPDRDIPLPERVSDPIAEAAAPESPS